MLCAPNSSRWRTSSAQERRRHESLRSEDSDKVVDALDQLLAQSRGRACTSRISRSCSRSRSRRAIASSRCLTGRATRRCSQGGRLSLARGLRRSLAGLSIVGEDARRVEQARIATDRSKLEAYLRERIALRGGAQAILLAEPPYTNRTLAQLAEDCNAPPRTVVIDVWVSAAERSALQYARRRSGSLHRLGTRRDIDDGGPTFITRGPGEPIRRCCRSSCASAVLTMQQAVRKMTSLRRRSWDCRGAAGSRTVLRRSRDLRADAVRSTATWEKPAQAPIGVEHVIVNGCVQVERVG